MTELKVEDHEIRHNPDNSKRVNIYVNKSAAERAKLKLKEVGAEERFNKFHLTIYGLEDTTCFNNPHSHHLVGNATENRHILPFQLMKSVSTSSVTHPGHHVATAGLVLQGFEKSRVTSCENGSDFFAVSTAHAVLTEDECPLLAGSAEDFRKIFHRVVGDLSFSTWFLNSPVEGGIHISEIPHFSYRHYYTQVFEMKWYEKFMHDILLFRLCKEDLEKKIG